LKFEPVPRKDRQELLVELASHDSDTVAGALYSATYHDPDWEWVQGLCLGHLDSPQVPIKWAAATCLGDLAMFHKKLDLEQVLPALKNALGDPTISSPAEMSLMLIEHSVPK
jgi:hypothetical protein